MELVLPRYQVSLSLAVINCLGPYEQSWTLRSLKPRNFLDTLSWLCMSTFSFRRITPPFNSSSLPVSLLSYFILFSFDDLLSRQMRPKSFRPIIQSSARWASGPQEGISGVKHYGNLKLEILVFTLESIV